MDFLILFNDALNTFYLQLYWNKQGFNKCYLIRQYNIQIFNKIIFFKYGTRHENYRNK